LSQYHQVIDVVGSQFNAVIISIFKVFRI